MSLHDKERSERPILTNENDSDLQKALVNVNHLTRGFIHDIRSGLGAVRNFMGFLEDDLDKSGHRSDLLKINQSLDFCNLILRNLSTLGGQETLQPQWIDIEVIVDEVFFILERKVVDVKLEKSIESTAQQILADEGQMKQVFMNLIRNAGEAMPDGGILTVRTRSEGEMLRIEVSDTGCGISPENQARLFKELFTTKERGYGLGLHIVHTIIERHGGTIAAESQEGQGTTFIIHLPIE